MFNLFLRMLEVTNHAPMMLYYVESMPLSIVQIFRQTSVSYLSYIEMLPKKFSSSKLSLYPQPPLLLGCRKKAKLEKSNTNITSRYWSLLANAFPFNLLNCMCHLLESTDADGMVSHLCPTWLPARRCHIWVFFFSDSRQLSLIHANAAQFMPNRLRFAPNRADSARIEPYRPYRVYRPAIDTVETYQKWPKQAKIDLESCWKSRNYHLKIIVMCFLPSSFFVLWIKA